MLINKIKYCIIVLVTFGISSIAFAEPILTPEEIMALVQASRQQYGSFEIEFTETSYKCKDFIPDVNHPDRENEILWRSSELGTYAKIKYKVFEYLGSDAKVQEKQHTRMYAITPKWSKKLKDVPKLSAPRGIVANGPSLKEELPFTVEEALWELFGQRDRLASENTELTYNENEDTYTLKKQAFSDGTTITVVINSAKGFLPTKCEFHKPSGELLMRCECSDFRKTTDDLWLPYQYVFATQSYMSVHRVRHAKVNVQFPKEALNFSFPPGTIVEDLIANLTYVVDAPQKDEDIIDLGTPEFEMPLESSEPDIITIDDIKNTRHAKENELLSADKKAQALIEKEKENQVLAKSKTGKYTKFESLRFVIFLLIIAIMIVLLVKWRSIVKNKK